MRLKGRRFTRQRLIVWPAPWPADKGNTCIERIAMKPAKMKNRELGDLIIVLIMVAFFALFSISINFTDRLYDFFKAYTRLPVVEFLIGVIFLSLIGLFAVTYRRWRDAAKKQEELENIIDGINPDVLLVVDPDRNILMCNASVKRMFGYNIDEVVDQKTDLLYFDRRSNSGRLHEIFEALENEGFHVGLATGKKKNGQTTPLEIVTGNLSGRRGAVLLLRDITDRKQAEKKLKGSFHKVRRLLEETVNVLASTVEMRDPYTAGHQRRVTELVCAMAEELSLSQDQIDGLRLAASVHDIGKLYVPAEILNKPGRLTEIEFNLIKAHPQVGHDLLQSIEFPWPVSQIVLQHHERLDGSGFPQGLSGDEILLEAKILAVADVVEAMSSHRPYRPAFGMDEALGEISQNKGTLYDAQAVEACLRLFHAKGFTFK